MVGIPLGHVLIFMPDQPLDMIQVNPFLDQPDRKSVSKIVKSEVLDVGFSPRTLKKYGQVKCP